MSQTNRQPEPEELPRTAWLKALFNWERKSPLKSPHFERHQPRSPILLSMMRAADLSLEQWDECIALERTVHQTAAVDLIISIVDEKLTK
jgi:hypothetical protein